MIAIFNSDVLAKNIKKYRKLCGYKQSDIAKLLFTTPQSVSKWEQGICVPNIENLCELSRVLKVPISDLIDGGFKQREVLVGIDGGGTKTEFVMFLPDGSVIKRIVLEGSNPNICTLTKTNEILKSGIDALISNDVKVVSIYVGIAGGMSGDNKTKIVEHLSSLYPKTKIDCQSDILSVSASALVGEKCITAICGTGSIVCAINDKKIDRVGGWGYLFEKQGSGYDIGRDAICAALAEREGTGAETLITSLVEKRLGTTVWDSIARLYSEKNAYIASFSSEVFEAYKIGDNVATEILKDNMQALATRINFAAKKYDCEKNVVVSGGIIQRIGFMAEMLMSMLDDDLIVTVPSLPQIYGACRLSHKLSGNKESFFTENFESTYNKIIKDGQNA